jgi:hypothetical protein
MKTWAEFDEGLYYLYRWYKGQQQAQEDLRSIIQAPSEALTDKELSYAPGQLKKARSK